jgi:hypothetical protein
MVCIHQIIITIIIIIITSHIVDTKDKQKHKINTRVCEKYVIFRKILFSNPIFLENFEKTTITRFQWRNTSA